MLQAFRIIISYPFERRIQVSVPQFFLERFHENSRIDAQTVCAVVHSAAGTARVSAQDRQQFVAFRKIYLNAIGHRAGDFCAASTPGFAIESLPNRLSRLPCAFETKRRNLRTGQLEYADMVFMT